MKEKQVEKYLATSWETRTGGLCIKFPPLFYAGFPDRICLCRPAIIVFVETKAPHKVPRPLQVKVQNRLKALGFPVENLDTIEKVDDFLVRYDNTVI